MYCGSDPTNTFKIQTLSHSTHETYTIDNSIYVKYPQLKQVAKLLKGSSEPLLKLLDYYEEE